MTEKELKVPFSAPLNELDTEVQTYGCRANNLIFVQIILRREFVLSTQKIVFVENLQELGKSNLTS